MLVVEVMSVVLPAARHSDRDHRTAAAEDTTNILAVLKMIFICFLGPWGPGGGSGLPFS